MAKEGLVYNIIEETYDSVVEQIHFRFPTPMAEHLAEVFAGGFQSVLVRGGIAQAGHAEGGVDEKPLGLCARAAPFALQ